MDLNSILITLLIPLRETFFRKFGDFQGLNIMGGLSRPHQKGITMTIKDNSNGSGNRRPASSICLADDDIIRCVDGEETMRPFIERVCRVLLGDDAVEVESYASEVGCVSVKLSGKDVEFDVIVRTVNGPILDIEAQKYGERDLPHRMAAYASMLLIDQLEKGVDYDKARDVYVVFICEKDYLRLGVPAARIEPTAIGAWKEAGIPFHWIALCGDLARKASPANDLEAIAADFFCTDPEQMHDKALSERLKYMRRKEVLDMIDYEDHEKMKARLRAEGIAEGIAEGRAEGKKEKQLEIAKKMLEGGLSPEDISRYTGLSLEEIKDIPAQKKTI